MDLKKHTRRDFIRLTGVTAASVAIAACAPEPQVVEKIVQETVIVEKEIEKEVTVVVEQEVEEETPIVDEPEPILSQYREAPEFAERVARGELPPVDERIPDEPLVTPVMDSIGEYGGTMRVGGVGVTLMPGDGGLTGNQRQYFMRISHDLTEAIPNFLRDWDVSEDFTTITCYMRRGLKWSDGEPVTAEDMRFRYEDIWLDTEVTPLIHQRHRPGGQVMEFIEIDDYTFQFRFAVPHPNYIMNSMAHNQGYGNDNLMPAHYLKQFHIRYNENAGELARAAGFDFWYQYFLDRSNIAQNEERPNYRAYVVAADNPQFTTWRRNPYFWMVDPAGNQLPYVDSITVDKVADLSLLDAKVTGGQYDFAGFNTNVQNYRTYADAAEQGDYRLLLWESGKGSEVVYNVNMNFGDEMMREVFSDDRFRQALSLAINRQEINDVIYFGNAFPRQMTVIPSSRFFRPEFETAYADYDPERANALLDDMGLEWDATRTLRLWPNGERLIISWDLYESETPKGPITELVTEYWRDIGVEIRTQSITRTLLSQKIQANEEPMSLWHGDTTTDVLFKARPKFFVPAIGDENTWALLWGQWYQTGGEVGEEPPEDIKQLFDWFDEFSSTRSVESAQNILRTQSERIWIIGTVGNAPHVLITSNALRNVPEHGFFVWDSIFTYTAWPETWFFES